MVKKRKRPGESHADPNAVILVGGYELGEVVGEGGFGVVHRAVASDGRPVAFKKLHDRGADPEELAYEFRVLCRFEHPHIVPVLDFGFHDQQPYLVTAWIEGTDLRTFSRDRSLTELAPTLAGVLRALESMHARGVLHRDLKPENIITTTDGFAYVLDLGLAGLVGGDPGRSGTPAYAPPERLLGRSEDPRSDLYSFGVMLHELVAGQLPEAGQPVAVEPPELATLLAALLAPNPATRPRSANEVLTALASVTGVELEPERGLLARPSPTAPGLVGRDRLLGKIGRALRRSAHRLLAVDGAPGLGKSHLLHAIAREALAIGAHVIEARSVRDAVERRGSPSGRTTDSADILLADARGRPTVLLLDDVDRLPPAALEDLVRLGTRLDVAPRPTAGGLTVVLSYRGADLQSRGAEEAIARLCALKRCRRLVLPPLAERATAAFVSEFCGRHSVGDALLHELWTRGGGRPADMAELLRALLRTDGLVWDDQRGWTVGEAPLVWPPSAADALRDQIDALTAPERDLLRWIGDADNLRIGQLRTLAGEEATPETLARLAEAGLVSQVRTGRGASYTLASGLVLAALGDDPQAARRHDALRQAEAPGSSAWLRHAAAGDDRPAARRALAAAEATLEANPAGARRLLEPLARGAALARQQTLQATIALADAERRLGLFEEARKRLDGLDDVPVRLRPRLLSVRGSVLSEDDPALESTIARIEAGLKSPAAIKYAEAALRAAEALQAVSAEHRARVRALCERASTVARRSRAPVVRGKMRLAIGQLAEVEGQLEEASRAFDEARQLAGPEIRLRLDATRRLAFLHAGPKERELGRALADEAYALAETLGDRHELGRALIAQGYLAVFSGELRRGYRLYRRARRHLAGRGPVEAYLRALAALAYLALKLGRPSAAERNARRALRLTVGAAHAIGRLRAETNLAFALIRQGREAWPLLRRLHSEAETRGVAAIAGVTRYLSALDRIERGRLADARDLLEKDLQGDVHAELLVVELALLEGDVDRARAAVEAVAPPNPLVEAKRATRRAMVALAAGDLAAAEAAIAEAHASGGTADDHFVAIELALVGVDAALQAPDNAARAAERMDELQRLVHSAELPSYHVRMLVRRERLGGGGHTLAQRVDDLRTALDRMEGLGLWRDAADVATVLAARLGPGEERARARQRAEAAHRAMLEGLDASVVGAVRPALAERARRLTEGLSASEGSDVPPRAAVRMLSVYRELAQEADPESLLPRVLDAACGLTGARRAFALIRYGSRLRVVASSGEGGAAAARGGPSRGIADEALRTARVVRVASAVTDDRFQARHSVRDVGVGGALAVPFRAASLPMRAGNTSRSDVGDAGGEAEGVIYLDDGGSGVSFSQEDEVVVQALADQAALASALARARQSARRRSEGMGRTIDSLHAELRKTSEDLRSVRSVLAIDLERIEDRFEGMLGRSKAMRKVFGLVERFAPESVPVLITGETGTGKELCARAIHARSPRRERPFVAINCGSLAESLLESELFGHDAGAFTGANRAKPGVFEQADGGSVLLDEVGEMPLAMQAALLRVLETGEVRRVGGRRSIRVDVRIIAATHRNLQEMAPSGDFREDLRFRLDVVRIELPPLRERLEDLPLLCDHIVRELSEAMQGGFTAGAPPELTRSARRKLLAHAWPGNVRELRNVLARALILSNGRTINAPLVEVDAPRRGRRTDGREPAIEVIDFQVAKARWIRSFLEAAVRRTGGNVTKASELTGMKRQALSRLLRNHGVDPNIQREHRRRNRP